ncbi:MAG: SIR2 family NAD-dependent protein deacylase [Flammeovirgaceae bacterium]
MNQQVIKSLEKFIASGKKLVVATGAGISAESNIPTYRGVEGYWTKGSRNYKPEEIGTFKFFQQEPYEVWKFALYRRSLCLNASPNSGHYAIAELESLLGNRFGLVTQNVDGLHIRAGNSLERTCQVHGHINEVRCMDECQGKRYPFPEGILPKQLDEDIPDAEWEKLVCPDCSSLLRPHVLWFDEIYDERNYRFQTAQNWGKRAGLLLTIGTTGMTYMPNNLSELAIRNKALIIDVNITENRFAKAAQKFGFAFQEKSGIILPQLVKTFKELLDRK